METALEPETRRGCEAALLTRRPDLFERALGLGPSLHADVHGGHVEKLELFERPPVQFLYDIPGIRALNLKTVANTIDCLALGISR